VCERQSKRERLRGRGREGERDVHTETYKEKRRQKEKGEGRIREREGERGREMEREGERGRELNNLAYFHRPTKEVSEQRNFQVGENSLINSLLKSFFPCRRLFFILSQKKISFIIFFYLSLVVLPASKQLRR